MELKNEFTVDVPVDEAWAVLTDLERIAPCMPGAKLEESDGENYKGKVKVKVGPVTAEYRGTARFLERDADAHRAVLRAEGRETRGQGNAAATITAMLAGAGEGTQVTVVTDLAITGRVAQFGRGVLGEVSTKLLGQFVASLESTVLAGGNGSAGAEGAPGAAAAGAEGGAAGAAGGTGSAGAPAATTAAPEAEAPAERGTKGTGTASAAGPSSGNGHAATGPSSSAASAFVQSPAPDEEPAAVDLGRVVGPAIAKRLAPVLGGLFLVWLVWRLRRRHRR